MISYYYYFHRMKKINTKAKQKEQGSSMDELDDADEQIKNQQTHFIKCSSKKYNATQYCFDPNCLSKNRWKCSQRLCKQCKKEHTPKCSFADIDHALQKINQKISKTDAMKQLITSTSQRLIKAVNQYTMDILKLIDQKIKNVTLHDQQRNFLQFAKTQNSTIQFTSKDTYQLRNVILKEVDQALSIQNRILEEFKSFEKSIQNTLKGIKTSINSTISYFENQNKQPYKQQFEKDKYLKDIEQQKEKLFQLLGSKGSIITEVQYQNRLINMFENQPKRIDLLLKGSQVDFEISKFFDQCGQKTNLIVMCKTNKDKIIGAYSPCCHYSGSLTFASDDGSSFIFSLSQNQKYTILDSQYAVLQCQDKSSITFGFNQFWIGNKKGTQATGYFSLQKKYYNTTHSKHAEGFLKMNGNQTANFTIKQWQIWQVEFFW